MPVRILHSQCRKRLLRHQFSLLSNPPFLRVLNRLRAGYQLPWLHGGSLGQARGVKSRKTADLKELPQGVLEADLTLPEQEDDTPVYPTMVHQARTNMRKFENCVVLTRVGGFYELYFEQADEYGPLLNLKVAQKRTVAGPVPMSGFPFFQLDRFLKILVQDLSKNVAISEEFPNDASARVKSGGLLFDRRVTRIVTPGTLVDEKFIDPFENNFLLAMYGKRTKAKAQKQEVALQEDGLEEPKLTDLITQPIGIAWLDVSTGEFFTQCTNLAMLPSELVRIGAKEIIMSSVMNESLVRDILHVLRHDQLLITQLQSPLVETPISNWTPMLENSVPMSEQSKFSTEEVAAGSMLLEYVRDKLQGLGMKLQPPTRRQEADSMGIDKNSMSGLEILATSRGGLPGGKGSLLHTVRQTVTRSGARLLRDRISSPSTSLHIINQRLDLVEEFIHDPCLREDMIHLLERTFDSQRLVQKFSLGRGDADDLMSLLRTITATNDIFNVLQEPRIPEIDLERSNIGLRASLDALVRRLSLESPNTLAQRIINAIDEDGLDASHRTEQMENSRLVSMAQDVLNSEGASEDIEAMSTVARTRTPPKSLRDVNTDENDVWIMRRTANRTLEQLHNQLAKLREEKSSLTDTLREDSGAQSLTLRWTPGLGHICHIRGVRDVRVSAEFLNAARNASSSKSTRSFYLPEWSKLGERIDQARLQIRGEEQRIFQELREEVVRNLVKLRRNAAVLDELDIACSSAILAQEQGFVRPILDKGMSHRIVGGRHPTVKLGLEEQGRAFVSNDCSVGDKERIWLITGPNMAGKSTFLRQNALISIMAQIGSFVPAEHAEIGIVDHIFSRIGSADNLFQDQSTFMVEMLETAAILKQATPRSFVIMDEVGRGTTPEDGVAVGYASLWHLYHTNRCRTLFATHFHVLTDMTSEWEQLGCYCTDVAETVGGAFSYVHKLRPGVNRQSHALKVARLAGMPDSAIKIAEQVLESFNRPTAEDTKKPSQIAASA